MGEIVLTDTDGYEIERIDGFTAVVTLTNERTHEMYRYDGGHWIEVCEPGIGSSWEDLIYVWDDEINESMIGMNIEDIVITVLRFLYQIEDEA